MNKKRPINLELGTLTFPSMAIASILHRISGIVLFLLLPFMLCLLDLSLLSDESFAHLQVLLTSPYYKIAIWVFLTALGYHLFAGIRHLLMDCGIGEHLPQGSYSAIAVIVCSVILTFLLGIWLW